MSSCLRYTRLENRVFDPIERWYYDMCTYQETIDCSTNCCLCSKVSFERSMCHVSAEWPFTFSVF